MSAPIKAATDVILSEARIVRATMADLLTFVQGADAEAAREALDKVRMAREWARLKKVAQEVTADLLRVEIACLRRIVALDATSILSVSQASAARFFAPFTDTEIADLIARFPGTSSAITLQQHVRAKAAADRARQGGRDFAANPGPAMVTGNELNRATRAAGRDFAGAMAAVLDRLAASDDVTVAEMTAVAYDELNITPRGEMATDTAIREGIAEVCRQALRQSKALTVGELSAPKFVTCLREDGVTWTRVPFASATLSQLDQMIELREEQLRQDRAALDRLKAVRTAVSNTPGGAAMPLGKRVQAANRERAA